MVDFAQSGRSLIASFYWSDGTPVDAIDLMDEYSAYLCGLAARVEYPSHTDSLPSGDVKRGRLIETDLWRLRNVLRQRNWPHVQRLDELLKYGSAKYAEYGRRVTR
jgi:hypothetical protein